MRLYRAGKDGRISPTTGQYVGPEPSETPQEQLRPPTDAFEEEYESLYNIETRLLGPRVVNMSSWQQVEYALRMGFIQPQLCR